MMFDASRYQQAKSIFFEACEQPEEQREAFVDRACAGDSALREAVRELLRHDQQPLSVVRDGHASAGLRMQIEQLMESTGSENVPPAGLPLSIGRYRVLSKLGEGGMGIVYLAEQDHPRRQVALKVMSSGATNRDALRRFEHEAQILGRLHHPGIAQIFDAGVYDDGGGARPYFAMELVRGCSINRFCQQSGLDVRSKLELFISICQAVQHAHQQGVIHRDLKPGNILMELRDESAASDATTAHHLSSATFDRASSGPRIKILDFGVARMTDSDVQATTMHTAADQLIGTVAYMSPEQMSGVPDAIDTRSDVYALGIILFELLAERLPHDVGGKTIPEMIRTISSSDPTSLASISRAYRGDLATITGKAMEREKSRRYQSAGELAADIRRYLNDQPILARPPTTLYQFRKFARRNKALVGGAAAVFVVLVAGLVSTAWQAHAARQAAAVARDQADKATTVADFLQRLLASADPHVSRGQEFTVRQLLESFRGEIQDAFDDQPEVRAMVLDTVGEAYQSLGDVDAAEPLLREALDIRRRLASGSDDVDLAHALAQWAWLAHDREQFREAEANYREALIILDQVKTEDVLWRKADALAGLGDVLRHQSRLQESIEALQQAVAIRKSTGSPGGLARTIGLLAAALEQDARPREAISMYREALELRTSSDGQPSVSASTAMSNLGEVLLGVGEYAEAEQLLRASLEHGEKFLGAEHPEMAKRWNNLGLALSDLARNDEAIDAYHRALEMHRRHPSYPPSDRASILQNLAVSLANDRQFQEAEPFIREAIELSNAAEQIADGSRASRMGILGDLLMHSGRAQEAGPLVLAALEELSSRVGSGHDTTLLAMHRVGIWHIEMGRLTEAVPQLQQAFDGMLKLAGPSRRDTVMTASSLAQSLLMSGRPDQARGVLESVVEAAWANLGPSHFLSDRVMHQMFVACARLGDWEAAEDCLRRRLEAGRVHNHHEAEQFADMLMARALIHLRWESWSSAEEFIVEALKVLEALGNPQPITAVARWRYGASLVGQKRPEQGLPLLLESFAQLRAGSPDRRDDLMSACAWLVEAYTQTGDSEQAEHWRTMLKQIETRDQTERPNR